MHYEPLRGEDVVVRDNSDQLLPPIGIVAEACQSAASAITQAGVAAGSEVHEALHEFASLGASVEDAMEESIDVVQAKIGEGVDALTAGAYKSNYLC